MKSSTSLLIAIATLGLTLWLAGCGGAGGAGNGDGGPGGPGVDAGGPPVDAPRAELCGTRTCPQGALCRHDTCVPDLGTCDTYDDCPGDAYCDSSGACLPYGVPAAVVNDPECVRGEPLDGVIPRVQCEWTGPAAGDATEGSNRVYTTPIVADLNLDQDPDRLQPSIIITTWEDKTVDGTKARTGTLRVFDGRTCEEQLHVGGDDEPDEANRPGYGTQWAVGDLDGDVPSGGHPEIVGLHRTAHGSSAPLALYAFRIDPAGPGAERMWYGRDCDTGETVTFFTNQANYGPGLWDLDDDGVPEIVVDTLVFDAGGCLLNTEDHLGYITHGRMTAVADVDLDGAVELIAGDRLAEWDPITTEWIDEAYFAFDSNSHRPGHVAVADLGQYSTLPGVPVPNQLPEIIVVSAETLSYDPDTTGTIRVQTLDGTVIWGPLDLYHTAPETAGGHGGAPTASDFDGDGQVELAAAANQYYTVYDPDCEAALGGQSPSARPGGLCQRAPDMADLPDGLLWAQLSQDRSSSGTGSSVFDFNGDGRAEAVYGDECYMRVYDGASGQVLYSAPASNGTGFEFPTIADVDGDFATEVVVARSPQGGCPSPDPLFPDSGDFTSGTGFVILRDPEDRWASSRPIWNQHAYSVTNVSDDARIPRTSDVEPNWIAAGLNNFRQNTQGELGVLNIADLTVVFSAIDALCTGEGGVTPLEARVCNRGTNPVQDGVTVEFVESDGSIDQGAPLCATATTRLLRPGECQDVTCMGDLSGQRNVFVRVDPEGTIADCHPGNNDGAGVFTLCVIVE